MNVTAERSVLATLAFHPDLYHEVGSELRPFMFAAHQEEAEWLFELLEESKPSLAEIERIKEWWDMSDRIGIARNVIAVRSAWQVQEERKIHEEAAQMLAAGKKPEDVSAEVDARMDMVREFIPRKEYETKFDSWKRLADSMGRNAQGKREGIMTGFELIDQTGGLVAPDQITLAGRPGMGKTCIGLDIALNAAKSGAKVVYYTREMGRDQIRMRLLAKESGVPFSKQRWAMLKGNGLSKEEHAAVTKAIDALYGVKLLVVDDINRLSELKRSYRTLAKTYGVDLFVFDYLQRFDPEPISGETKASSVGRMARELKNLALENQTANLVLAQLSRGVESRPDKRPMLSDLKESGGIEEEADLVLMAYRAEYYNIVQDDSGNDLRGLCELMCVKDRHSTGMDNIFLQYDKERERYTDRNEDQVSNSFPVSESTRIEKRADDDDEIPF